MQKLNLPLPPSVNGLFLNIRGRGRVLTPRYREWRRTAKSEILIARPFNYEGKVRLSIALGRPDKRKRDASNFVKAIEDVLVQMRVIEDDSLIDHLSVSWTDEHPGRAIVTVEDSVPG